MFPSRVTGSIRQRDPCPGPRPPANQNAAILESANQRGCEYGVKSGCPSIHLLLTVLSAVLLDSLSKQNIYPQVSRLNAISILKGEAKTSIEFQEVYDFVFVKD